MLLRARLRRFSKRFHGGFPFRHVRTALHTYGEYNKGSFRTTYCKESKRQSREIAARYGTNRMNK